MKEGQDKRTNEELLSEFLIANHNLESTVRKMHDLGRTKELEELFNLFMAHYRECETEILRRMANYGSRKKQSKNCGKPSKRSH